MGAGRHGKSRQRTAAILLCVASCLVAAVLFETGVRIFEPQPADWYRYSVHTYYEPVPQAEFVYEREEFRVPVRFNRFGMRDRERSLAKREGVRRIALLGDSFAEAMQVPEDSMVSRRLERELRSCHAGEAVEVLNFGVSGFGTAAAAARYASLARRFAPDLVVLLFVRNDPWDLVQQDSRLYEVREGRLVLRPLQPGWLSRWLRTWIDFGKHHFHAQRFLKYRFMRWRQASLQVESVEKAQADDGELRPGEAAWERMHMALALLRDLARHDGARLLVAQATTAGPDMDASLGRICSTLDIPLLDLVPALDAAPGPVFFRIDGHWRNEGHAVASTLLAPWLCDFLSGGSASGPWGAPAGTSGGEWDL